MMAVIDVEPLQEDLQKHDMAVVCNHDRPSDPFYGFRFQLLWISATIYGYKNFSAEGSTLENQQYKFKPICLGHI